MSKIKNGGLDQYSSRPFEQQQFGIAGVEEVNDSSVACDYDRCSGGDDDVNVVGLRRVSQSTSDDESSDLVVLCGLPPGEGVLYGPLRYLSPSRTHSWCEQGKTVDW